LVGKLLRRKNEKPRNVSRTGAATIERDRRHPERQERLHTPIGARR
jgi:hypothetical protein